ncbi:hypothetical protein SAMN04487835_101114 [Sharpea azabuensis]|nr:hypothetical protein SAMN04487836_101114 [Sharpea azabuensis]SFK47074.1 hypothetical protein SAMN04487835_101114 [Sharpea azabuensis]
MMEGSFLSIQNDSDETEWKFYAKFYITSYLVKCYTYLWRTPVKIMRYQENFINISDREQLSVSVF